MVTAPFHVLLVAPEMGAGFELVALIYEDPTPAEKQAILDEFNREGFPYAAIARADTLSRDLAGMWTVEGERPTDAPEPDDAITLPMICAAWRDRIRARLTDYYGAEEAARRLRPRQYGNVEVNS